MQGSHLARMRLVLEKAFPSSSLLSPLLPSLDKRQMSTPAQARCWGAPTSPAQHNEAGTLSREALGLAVKQLQDSPSPGPTTACRYSQPSSPGTADRLQPTEPAYLRSCCWLRAPTLRTDQRATLFLPPHFHL